MRKPVIFSEFYVAMYMTVAHEYETKVHVLPLV
jgi:hypothetical protein